MYTVIFRERYQKVFDALDQKTQQKITSDIERLSQNPFTCPHVRKLTEYHEYAFRLRSGRWRIIYFLISKDKKIDILDLFLKKSPSDYRKRWLLFS